MEILSDIFCPRKNQHIFSNETKRVSIEIQISRSTRTTRTADLFKIKELDNTSWYNSDRNFLGGKYCAATLWRYQQARILIKPVSMAQNWNSRLLFGVGTVQRSISHATARKIDGPHLWWCQRSLMTIRYLSFLTKLWKAHYGVGYCVEGLRRFHSVRRNKQKIQILLFNWDLGSPSIYMTTWNRLKLGIGLGWQTKWNADSEGFVDPLKIGMRVRARENFRLIRSIHLIST